MATIARTVHLNDPETGELLTLVKGTEIPDDEYDEFVGKFNNPAIFEDPDASESTGGLDDLGDEEFFFAADANGTVDTETFDEQREARRESASAGGSIDFGTDISGYSSWKIGDLRDEYNERVARGVDMPEADMKNKQSLASALTATDDAGDS